MNTKILTTDIYDCNFLTFKEGDQCIYTEENEPYDIQHIYFITKVKYESLYFVKHIELFFKASKQILSSCEILLFFSINGDAVLINSTEADDDTELTHDNFFSTLFSNVDIYRFKTDDPVDFIDLQKRKIYTVKTKINDCELLLAYEITLNDKYMYKRFHYSLITSNYKFIVFKSIENPNLLDYLIEKTSDPQLIKFKNEIINTLNYSIEDYIKDKDNSKLISLLGDDSEKYFKPIFEKDKFKIYLDYLNNLEEVVIEYNGVQTKFVANDYKRIIDAFNDYYYDSGNSDVYSGIYPLLTNPEFEDKNNDFSIEYNDCDGMIISDNSGGMHYRTILYGVLTKPTSKEKEDILNRKETFNTLTQ